MPILWSASERSGRPDLLGLWHVDALSRPLPGPV